MSQPIDQSACGRPAARLIVSGAEVHRWVVAVAPYAAGDGQHPEIPVLRCIQVLVHPQPDGAAVLYLAATNRYALGIVQVRGVEIDGTTGTPGPWDLTIPAHQVTQALTGIPARRRERDIELVITPAGVSIRPEHGFARHLPAAGHAFPRWDIVMHSYNPTSADTVDTITMTPRHLAVVARAMQHAGSDVVQLRTIRTPAGAPMIAYTITSTDQDVPWFTGICMAQRPSQDQDSTRLSRWADLDELTTALDHQRAEAAAPGDREPAESDGQVAA